MKNELYQNNFIINFKKIIVFELTSLIGRQIKKQGLNFTTSQKSILIDIGAVQIIHLIGYTPIFI